MEFTVAVLYQGTLTHYAVTERENGMYEAGLLKHAGEGQHQPPGKFCFRKEGRHCSGEIEDQDLMDEVYHAVIDQKKRGGPFNPGNNPRMPYADI
jgi:hypothetical protein